MARQHHDYQRQGNPVGYYVPGMDPRADGGNAIILGHKNVTNPKISDKLLVDDDHLRSDLGRRHRVGMGGQRPF